MIDKLEVQEIRRYVGKNCPLKVKREKQMGLSRSLGPK